MTFPEIHEADASGETAAIYLELRNELGLPLVNLIWRHFATLPGVLPWAWTTVQPVARSSEVLGGLGRMEREVLRLVGARCPPLPSLTTDQAAVVEIYNRGNAANLQLLTALKRVVRGEGAGGGSPLDSHPTAPVALSPAPSMPRLSDLDPNTAQLVRSLAGLHGEEGTTAIPSLYRHLALWPELLPPLHNALLEVSKSGLLADGRRAVIALAEATASRLMPALRPPGSFPADQCAATLETLEAFTGRLIADLSVVGLLLRNSGGKANAP